MDPARYRQIIETESCDNLELEECTWISKDQKHSLQVTKMQDEEKQPLMSNHVLTSSFIKPFGIHTLYQGGGQTPCYLKNRCAHELEIL